MQEIEDFSVNESKTVLTHLHEDDAGNKTSEMTAV
jgi:hypothetical protein